MAGDAVLAVQAPRIAPGIIAHRAGRPFEQRRIEVDSLGHARLVGRAEQCGQRRGKRLFLGKGDLGRVPPFKVQLEPRRVVQPAAQHQGHQAKQ